MTSENRTAASPYWGFCFKEEIARGRDCSLSLRCPCQPGKN
ncbi:unnamed protein product, partial [Brassica oleracea]